MRRFCFVGLMVLASVVACSDDPESPFGPNPDAVDFGGDAAADAENESGDDTTEDVATEPGELEIEASLVENPRNVLSCIVTVTTSADTEVAIEFWSDDTPVQQTSSSPLGTDHEIAVVGFRAETTYTLRPLVTWNGQPVEAEILTFTTSDLPTGIPQYEVIVHDADNMQPGITAFGVGPTGSPSQTSNIFYIAVDEQGEVVWYYRDPDSAAHMDRDVKMLSDGNLLISLQNEFRIITIGGETVTRFYGNGSNNLNLHHDAVEHPNRNILALSHEREEIYVETMENDVNMIGDRIVELALDGSERWEWSAFDYLDTGRFPGPLSLNRGGDGAFDWTHSNAVVYLENEDAILLSIRHQNWIVKLAYPDGDIIWRLGEEGDFTLVGDGDWFYSQHAPMPLSDGRILLYDNGNEREVDGSAYSRAVIFALDETDPDNLTAEQVWEYRTEKYTPFLGDADMLPNGNILVCAGGAEGGRPPTPAPPTGQIIEVTMEDPAQVVWELTATGNIYRATRLTSFWPE